MGGVLMKFRLLFIYLETSLVQTVVFQKSCLTAKFVGVIDCK